MTTRSSSSSIIFALAMSFAFAPVLLSKGQTPAPADTSSTNATPAAATTPAPSAPADTTSTNAAPATAAPSPDTSASSTAPEERPSTYTIVKGDSLWTIAHKYGTTVVKLRKANNLKKHALLHPGQVLQIPPATTDAAAK